MILLSIILGYVLGADQLIQIQALWRHGARTPIFCNWNCDEFKSKQMLEGYLTPTGMRQHFVLGQWMRKRYIEQYQLLNDQYDAKEIMIYATDVNRTIMSAMSNMQGMYPNNGPDVPQVKESYLRPPNPDSQTPDIGDAAIKYNIQVLPIHMRQSLTDIQLRAYGAPQCAQAKQFQIENQHTELAQRVNQAAQETIYKFCNEMNIDPYNFTIFNLSEYMDTFYTCKYNNYDMPLTLSDETYNLADETYSVTIALKLYQTWEQIRTQSVPFFEQFFNYTDGILNETSSIPSFKYVIYSAHDVTVQLIASALNITSAECMSQVYLKEKVVNNNCIYTYPGFASNIIWELWYSEESKENYIKILYNGTEVNLCGKTDLDKDPTKCSLSEFRRLINQQAGDYSKGCDIAIEPTIELKVPGWMMTLSIIFILLIIGLCFYGAILYKNILSKNGQNTFLAKEETY